MPNHKKGKPEWKFGKGFKGSARAALLHHPDKFSKTGKGGKMNVYAIMASMKKKGATPHYKDQKSTLEGKPKKKAQFKNESFSEFLAKRHPEFDK